MERLQDWLQIIGLVGVITSLIFVGLQFQQDQRIAVGEILGGIAASGPDLQMQSTEHAEVLSKAAKNVELSDTELVVLRQLVEIQETNLFLQSLAIRSFSDQPINTGDLLFVSFLFRHPAAREQWEQHVADIERYVDPLRTPRDLEKVYAIGSGAYRQQIRENLAKLDRLYE
jgi:hypothetical protein